MICIPLNFKTTTELLENLSLAQEKADIVEIWFDSIEDLTNEKLSEIFAKKTKPWLFKAEGELDQVQKVLAHKPEYLDLDILTPKEDIDALNFDGQLIISFHDFEKTPTRTELESLAQMMLEKGADILKFATTANQFSDSLEMLEFLNQLTQDKKAICICMGEEGRITRATGHLLGNYLMYAPLDQSQNTAPGQLTFEELQKIQKIYS